MIGEAPYVLIAGLYDPNTRWPSDNDGFDDDKLVIWENLTTGVRWPEVCHFSQWTPKSFAQGIRPLDAPELKRIVLWGPVPDLKNLRTVQQPQAPAVEVVSENDIELVVRRCLSDAKQHGKNSGHSLFLSRHIAIGIKALITSKGGR